MWQAGWLAEILDRKDGSENWNEHGKLDRRIGSETKMLIKTLVREIEQKTWIDKFGSMIWVDKIGSKIWIGNMARKRHQI